MPLPKPAVAVPAVAAVAPAAVGSRRHSILGQPLRERLLLIAQPGSYRLAPYLNAARRMGLEVLVASRGEHSLVSEVHQGLHIDLDDTSSALDRILEAGREAPFAGVLGCDDSTVELAALAANALALPHNPPSAARLTRRKDLARAHLTKSRCAVPIHRLVDLTRAYEDQVAG